MAKDPIKKADNGTYYFRANLGYNPITGKQIQKYRSGFRTKKEAKEEYSKQFKEDAVRYRKDHPELTVQKAAENLGISESALKNWMKAARENEGSVPTRGTGNYSSDEAKEIARLKRELRDTKDALEILKKAIGILGK